MSLFELLQTTGRAETGNEKVYGVVTAVVRDIRDPAGLGRVKVDYPWMAEDRDTTSMASEEDRAHSYWARIATLMAGNSRGSFFVPEVDDEVLVAFEHGDIDRPYVIGALWNAQDRPPEAMDSGGKNDSRTIRSRSGHELRFEDDTDGQAARITLRSQGGHQLNLDDRDDEGRVELITNGGHRLVLDDAGGTVTIEDGSGNRLELDANGNTLTIDTAGDQDQSVGGNLTINVTGSATISAPSGITLDSTSIKLGGSAALTLVNDTFLDIFNAHFHVGNLGAPTSPPTVPAIKNVQSTIFTKGA